MLKQYIRYLCLLLVLVTFGCVETLENRYPALQKPYHFDPNSPQTQQKDATGDLNQAPKDTAPISDQSKPSVTTPESVSSTTDKEPSPGLETVQPDDAPLPKETGTAIREKTADPSKRDTTQTDALPPRKTQLILDEALDFCQASQDFWQKGDLENAIEALDQAYSLILQIDNEHMQPELMQQKEDLRFTISKRILEIYASRNIVVNGHHKAIPIIMNHHIRREVTSFTRGREKKYFKAAYRRSGRYRPYILAALREAGLPEELSWLPLIESAFKVRALSRARALGLWQFIPSTGYKFGLKRDYYVDHRLDPEKSTLAAIAYLKELHRIFGDWTTVLAAYNCGEGRVLRVIRSQNVNYLDNFWDLYERLPRETARYVPRFLATLHVLNNAETYGLQDLPKDPPIDYEIANVTRSVRLRDIAKIIDVPPTVMTDLNPELRYKVLPPETYPLKIPLGTKSTLLAKLEELPTSTQALTAMNKHRVRRGETVSSIAKRYRSSVSAIRRANNLNRRNLIVAGQWLKIPTRKSMATKPKRPAAKPKKKVEVGRHVVKSGDSLWIIAKRYDTTTKQIQQANRLRGTRLSIGQRLVIPAGKTAPPSIAGLKSYRVRRGDSPFRIAQRHKISLERFLRINKLTPRSKIYPGQILVID